MLKKTFRSNTVENFAACSCPRGICSCHCVCMCHCGGNTPTGHSLKDAGSYNTYSSSYSSTYHENYNPPSLYEVRL